MTILNQKMKPITAAVGTAFVASLATASVANAENPFAVEALENGYDQLAQAEAEGKCGEGKCGESKGEDGEDGAKGDDEGKCGEGKCGESKGDDGAKGEGEGKCGEGKCGESKAEGEGKCGAAA